MHDSSACRLRLLVALPSSPEHTTARIHHGSPLTHPPATRGLHLLPHAGATCAAGSGERAAGAVQQRRQQGGAAGERWLGALGVCIDLGWPFGHASPPGKGTPAAMDHAASCVATWFVRGTAPGTRMSSAVCPSSNLVAGLHAALLAALWRAVLRHGRGGGGQGGELCMVGSLYVG